MREQTKKMIIEFLTAKVNYELTQEDLKTYKKNNIEEWRKYSSVATLIKKYRRENNFYSIVRSVFLKLYILADNKAKAQEK